MSRLKSSAMQSNAAKPHHNNLAYCALKQIRSSMAIETNPIYLMPCFFNDAAIFYSPASPFSAIWIAFVYSASNSSFKCVLSPGTMTTVHGLSSGPAGGLIGIFGIPPFRSFMTNCHSGSANRLLGIIRRTGGWNLESP